jgi:hypothetical protein
MAEATCDTVSKSTSPTKLPSASRVIPTSTTTAPAFTMSAFTKTWLTDSGNQYVGLPRDSREVLGAAMANGHGSVGIGRSLEQEQSQWFTDYCAATQDYHMTAGDGNIVTPKQLLHSQGCAGNVAGLARGQ